MDHLERFYDLVNSGTSVEEFLHYHAALFPYIRSNGLMAEYRLGKGHLKRLRDEISPAARFVNQHAAPDDLIQFPLNSSTPDCNVWHCASGRHRTIEITVVQALERLNLMTELNRTGCGRGFLGLTDNKPKAEFLNAMDKERQMYSTYEAQTAMMSAIRLCAQKKSYSQANTLLIEGPLLSLPTIRWEEIHSQLKKLVEALSFSEIYLVGRHDDGDLCLKLK